MTSRNGVSSVPLLEIPAGIWSGLTGKLNSGFTGGELTMIGTHHKSNYNMVFSSMLFKNAMALPPSTPERYDAVARYYSYGNVFIVKQEAPGQRPIIGWMDWEGGCPDFGENIKFMLDGVFGSTVDESTYQEAIEKFTTAIKEAKSNGTLIEIDSISKQ